MPDPHRERLAVTPRVWSRAAEKRTPSPSFLSQMPKPFTGLYFDEPEWVKNRVKSAVGQRRKRQGELTVTQNKDDSVIETKRWEKQGLSQLPEDILGEHKGLIGHPRKKRARKGLSLLLKLINFWLMKLNNKVSLHLFMVPPSTKFPTSTTWVILQDCLSFIFHLSHLLYHPTYQIFPKHLPDLSSSLCPHVYWSGQVSNVSRTHPMIRLLPTPHVVHRAATVTLSPCPDSNSFPSSLQKIQIPWRGWEGPSCTGAAHLPAPPPMLVLLGAFVSLEDPTWLFSSCCSSSAQTHSLSFPLHAGLFWSWPWWCLALQYKG